MDEDLGRRRVLQQLAAVHDRDAVAEADRFLHVVGDQQDGGGELALDRLEVVLRLGADQRVEGAERFVHQQQLRLGGERARDAHALLLSARQLVRVAPGVCRRFELEEIEQVFDSRVDATARPAEQRRHGGDVLRDGAMREKAVILDRVADAATQFVDGQLGRVPAVDPHPARARLDESVDHAQQRRFSRAGGADHDSESARLDDQADVVDGGDRVVDLGQPLDGDHSRALVTSSIVASRMIAAANASRTVGTAPSRIRSGAV